MLKSLARKALPAPLIYRLRLSKAIRDARQRREEAGDFHTTRNPLAQPLIVSLTSFLPRFKTLHLTIESLLNQTVMADELILWIAYDEIPLLPKSVLALQTRGLNIRGCSDIRSFKKLVYTLQERPGCFLATADDDLFYEPSWLQALVEGVDGSEQVIICHRAHRLAVREDGRIAPYLSWQMNVADDAARAPSRDIVPVGVGGILYPPNCFSAEVTDRALFDRLCPTADDLWFYWMARRVGSRHKKVGGHAKLIFWPTAAISSLMADNWAGGNDRQIRALEDAFGSPLSD